jgi:hypothetical protein
MPGDPATPTADPSKPAPSELAIGLARGVSRTLIDWGYATLTEFTLKNSRRVDVMGLDREGDFIVVEIKTSLADFRSDGKWGEYLDFCDRFFFAVPEDFPQEVLPDSEGLMIADNHAAVVLREAETRPMNGTRRQHQTRRFARTAAQRLFVATQVGITGGLDQ